MRSLNKCAELRSLTLQNCGLHAVEGLEKCTELRELHLKVSWRIRTCGYFVSLSLPSCTIFMRKMVFFLYNRAARRTGNPVCTLGVQHNKSTSIHTPTLRASEAQWLCFFSQNNKIEAINCRGLSKLEVISLANNNLASIHGFEDCSSVVSLDLCNNKITRIGEATQFINIILF